MTDFYRFEPVMETPGPDGQVLRKGAALYLEGAITPPRGWIDWDTFSYHPPQGFREQMEAIEDEELTVDVYKRQRYCGATIFWGLAMRRRGEGCAMTVGK